MNTLAIAPRRRSPRLLFAGIAALALGGGAAGVAWLDGSASADASRRIDPAALVAPLSARLTANPDDAEALWHLGRAYAAMGRPAEALPLYRRLAALRPDSADAHTDYARALGAANGRRFDDAARREVLRALELDPDHVMALALAGKMAYEQGDAATAIARWDRALARLKPDSGLAAQLQEALRTARAGAAK